MLKGILVVVGAQGTDIQLTLADNENLRSLLENIRNIGAPSLSLDNGRYENVEADRLGFREQFRVLGIQDIGVERDFHE